MKGLAVMRRKSQQSNCLCHGRKMAEAVFQKCDLSPDHHVKVKSVNYVSMKRSWSYISWTLGVREISFFNCLSEFTEGKVHWMHSWVRLCRQNEDPPSQRMYRSQKKMLLLIWFPQTPCSAKPTAVMVVKVRQTHAGWNHSSALKNSELLDTMAAALLIPDQMTRGWQLLQT